MPQMVRLRLNMITYIISTVNALTSNENVDFLTNKTLISEPLNINPKSINLISRLITQIEKSEDNPTQYITHTPFGEESTKLLLDVRRASLFNKIQDNSNDDIE